MNTHPTEIEAVLARQPMRATRPVMTSLAPLGACAMVVAIALGHPQVHQGHVDVAHVGHLPFIVQSVLGLQHHLAVGPVGEEAHQTVERHLVVVHHGNAQGCCSHAKRGWGGRP